MRTIIIAAALAAFAVPAFAQSPWTATPVQPASKSGYVAASVVWDCDAAGCRSTSDTSGAVQMAECRGLAREVGPLSSFVGHAPFTADRLADCNKAASKPKS
jgi:hypothetical protein